VLSVALFVIWKMIFSDGGQASDETTQQTGSIVVSTNDNIEERLATLERSNSQMKRQVSYIQLQGSDQNARAETGNGDANPEDKPIVLTPEEEKQREQLFNDQVLHSMSAAIDQQRDDPNWTEEAYNTLAGTLKEEELEGTQINDVFCGESLCRMTFLHNGLDDFERFRSKGLRGELFAGGLYFSYDIESNSTIVYVAKAGHPLPGPDGEQTAM
jgi:hypothetical protein